MCGSRGRGGEGRGGEGERREGWRGERDGGERGMKGREGWRVAKERHENFIISTDVYTFFMSGSKSVVILMHPGHDRLQ